MFREFFRKRKLRKLQEQFKAARPEMFDESSDTYNSGVFSPSPEASKFEQENIIAFPDLEFVFDEPNEFEREYFLPLISFDLNLVNSNWNGTAHFIYYQKTQSDLIESKHFLNEYGDYNCTIFQIRGQKVKYLGSEKVFQFDKDEVGFWMEAVENYNTSKKLIHTKGFQKSISQVNAMPKWIQSDETPKTVGDEKMYFIGQVDVNSFINVDEWIFLFYCPEKSIFIQVEQWT